MIKTDRRRRTSVSATWKQAELSERIAERCKLAARTGSHWTAMIQDLPFLWTKKLYVMFCSLSYTFKELKSRCKTRGKSHCSHLSICFLNFLLDQWNDSAELAYKYWKPSHVFCLMFYYSRLNIWSYGLKADNHLPR